MMDTSQITFQYKEKIKNIRYSTSKGCVGRKTRRWSLLLLLILSIIIPSHIFGQGYAELDKLVADTEEIRFPLASENGKWIAWYSFLGNGSKNMMFKSTEIQSNLVERKNINFMSFIKNHLAIQTGENLEYFNPETGKSHFLKNVNKFLYDETFDVFMILYTVKAGSKLEIYNSNLNLQQTIADVKYHFRDNYFVVRKELNGLSEVLVLNQGILETLFSTKDEVKNVIGTSNMRQKGYIIQTRNALKPTIHYISSDKTQYVLEGDQYNDYNIFSLYSSLSDQSVVLKLAKTVPKEKGIVDLWYGTDFDFRKYERDITEYLHVDWNPITGKQIVMTRPDYFGETSIGNSLYLMNAVDKDQVDRMDKENGVGFDKMYLWNSDTDVYSFISDVQKERQMVISPNGQYLLIQTEKNWQLYHTSKLLKEDIDIPSKMIPYFTSNQDVLWVGGNRISEQNLTNKKVRNVFQGNNVEIELIDFDRIYAEIGNKRDFRSADLNKNLLIKITDVSNQNISFSYLKNKKLRLIQSSTSDQITDFKKVSSTNDYFWITQNYNKRPTLMLKKDKETSIAFYVSDQGNKKFEQTELIRISYKGSDGEMIGGALYMPLNYDRSKKYPVVMNIYEKQDHLTKRFLKPSFSNPTGYNIALLLEQGFAVLLADISQSDKGPGISALESIDNALDELQKQKNVDMSKVGLMGQSFGGYQTNFIAGQSNRFAAYVSGASVSDVVRTYYAYNYHFNSPDYYRYERRQFWFKSTVAENPEKYIKNNPIMYAQNVSAPMLLWAGKNDRNVSTEGTKSLFIALRKYKKPVVALLYDNEGHSLSKKEGQKDLTLKILDWFNYNLKEKKNIPWIDKQMQVSDKQP